MLLKIHFKLFFFSGNDSSDLEIYSSRSSLPKPKISILRSTLLCNVNDAHGRDVITKTQFYDQSSVTRNHFAMHRDIHLDRQREKPLLHHLIFLAALLQ